MTRTPAPPTHTENRKVSAAIRWWRVVGGGLVGALFGLLTAACLHIDLVAGVLVGAGTFAVFAPRMGLTALLEILPAIFWV